MQGFLETFWVALRLGLTSFGGPSAHLGYFRTEYVERRGWLTDERFAELVAVVQFLPGPSSSQLGAAGGYARGRWAGALGAWLGFTTPSAVAMAVFAAVAARVDLTGAVWPDRSWSSPSHSPRARCCWWCERGRDIFARSRRWR